MVNGQFPADRPDPLRVVMDELRNARNASTAHSGSMLRFAMDLALGNFRLNHCVTTHGQWAISCRSSRPAEGSNG
jgi:hypothetical protein